MIKSWYLAGAPVDGNALLFPMDCFPITVGRSRECSLTIESQDVSRIHARMEMGSNGELRLFDLSSTNGTFVNRTRINIPTVLNDGDILHFGSAEFRLKCRPTSPTTQDCENFVLDRTCVLQPNLTLPENYLLLEKEFIEMLAENRLDVAWQPIVDARNFKPVAYEVLGRGDHPALPRSPSQLFSLAAKLGKEAVLSHAFRLLGAKKAAKQIDPVCLFMNSHPVEIFSESFFESIAEIQSLAPHMKLVMEVHETAVNEGNKMRSTIRRLRAMDVRIAYDDFGAGQSRLEELADMPADFVKFASSLIRNLDRAPDNKLLMVERLVGIVLSIGSTPLAEGIETAAEAAVCRQMGFKLYQGNLTGKPQLVTGRSNI